MHKRVEIKICGITESDEAVMLNKTGIDYAGFVFAESVRRISFKKAEILASVLSMNIKKVGVFTSVDTDDANRLFEKGIIDIVQLHTADFQNIGKIKAPVWISFSVRCGQLDEFVGKTGFADGIHFDTYDEKLAGGTGRAFNWHLVGKIKTEKKLILAGGLNYKNIKTALMTVKADVVDVSSGVEMRKNGVRKKDRGLIKKFVDEVREYEKQR